jgi:hypothetical protein
VIEFDELSEVVPACQLRSYRPRNETFSINLKHFIACGELTSFAPVAGGFSPSELTPSPPSSASCCSSDFPVSSLASEVEAPS